jgi:hypothetical protein
MLLTLIGAVIKGAFGIGQTVLTNRAEVVQAKHDRKLSLIKGEQSWDQIQAENSKESWKDEWLTIIFTAPFVGMFVAVLWGNEAMIVRFREAFIVLDNDMPSEYWYLLSVIVAASFGVKAAMNVLSRIRGVKPPEDPNA